MPPKIKISKDEIFHVALNIVRECGHEAINARDIAKKLNCSTQPIFSNYKNMEELKKEIVSYSVSLHNEYIKNEIEEKFYPDYKATGMAYIKFAKYEKELFKLLFMRDARKEYDKEDMNWQDIVDLAQKHSGVNKTNSELFHLEMWLVVHGIATMQATSYMDFDESFVSDILSDMYNGLKLRFSGGIDGSNKNWRH